MDISARKKYFWLLAAIVFVFLFLFLGLSPFNTKGEPREAVVAVSMLNQDNWILPVNNGIDMAYKPPLFHWCIAAISSVTGAVTEYTSRMPSALALAAMALAGFAFYAKRRGVQVAFIAALITLTNFEVHRAGTNCRVDMLLTAFMVISLYLLYKWCERGMKGVPWSGILCLSGAFLTKGPVGMLLPCLVIAVFLLIRGQRFVEILWKLTCIALASCVLPLLWYVAAYRQGGDEFLQLVLEENVLRFLGKMTYGSHENPVYYNFLTVMSGFLPYTLMALLSLFTLNYRHRITAKPRQWWTRFKAYIRKMDDTRLFTLLSIVVIFVFYCIPKSKRSVYLLPIYPFIAYFLAEYILWLVRTRPGVVKSFGYTMAALSLIVGGAFIYLGCGGSVDFLFSGKHAAQNMEYAQSIADSSRRLLSGGLVLLMLATALSYIIIYTRQKLDGKGCRWMFAVVITLFMAFDGVFAPAIMEVKTDKPVAERIAEIVPQGKLYSCHKNQTSGNPMRQFTVNFYLGDRVVPFDAEKPATGYLIAGEEEAAEFSSTHPGYALQLVFDSGHHSCDDRKILRLYRFSKEQLN